MVCTLHTYTPNGCFFKADRRGLTFFERSKKLPKIILKTLSIFFTVIIKDNQQNLNLQAKTPKEAWQKCQKLQELVILEV